MPKSRKQKINCTDGATMYGLQQWYVAMFEKLGWMILAKSKGHMEDKIVSYKLSLNRLEEKIRCKINTTYDMDKQIDLKLMLQDVSVLIDHVHKDF
jgi:hypothetical protein